MNSPRQRHRLKPSTWSRARRDLASPQGLNLMIALMLCFLLTVVGLILESVLNVPKSIITVFLIVGYIVIIAVAMYRILAMNKRADEARREAYRQKFEKHLETMKPRSSEKTGEKEP